MHLGKLEKIVIAITALMIISGAIGKFVWREYKINAGVQRIIALNTETNGAIDQAIATMEVFSSYCKSERSPLVIRIAQKYIAARGKPMEYAIAKTQRETANPFMLLACPIVHSANTMLSKQIEDI